MLPPYNEKSTSLLLGGESFDDPTQLLSTTSFIDTAYKKNSSSSSSSSSSSNGDCRCNMRSYLRVVTILTLVLLGVGGWWVYSGFESVHADAASTLVDSNSHSKRDPSPEPFGGVIHVGGGSLHHPGFPHGPGFTPPRSQMMKQRSLSSTPQGTNTRGVSGAIVNDVEQRFSSKNFVTTIQEGIDVKKAIDPGSGSVGLRSSSDFANTKTGLGD